MKKFIIKHKVVLISITAFIILITSILVTFFVTKSVYSSEQNNVIEADKEDNTVYDLANINFTDVASEQSVKVKARVYPFNADDKSLEWSVQWKNPSSEWATGKTVTDYVAVTADNNDSTIATVSHKQAFAEVIMLTASSISNPDVTATVEINEKAEVIDVYFVLKTEKNGVVSVHEYCKKGKLDPDSSPDNPIFIDGQYDEYGMSNVRITEFSCIPILSSKIYTTYDNVNFEISYGYGSDASGESFSDIVKDFSFDKLKNNLNNYLANSNNTSVNFMVYYPAELNPINDQFGITWC